MNYNTVHLLNDYKLSYDIEKMQKDSQFLVTSKFITHNLSKETVYVTNIESQLQRCIRSKPENRVLTTRKLFKKYVFHTMVDELPYFPHTGSFNQSMSEVSEQILALMLALWMESPKIYLFGYNIEDLEERSKLMSLVQNYPHSDIFYVRKPNVSKIKIFEAYENMHVIDYKEYENVG